MKKIALITPLRDEMNNLEKIIHSIRSQSIPIDVWVIVENDSTDGSTEYLKELKKVDNVNHLEILNLKMQDGNYGLGTKYASVVRSGFDHLEQRFDINSLDYIGILDGDIHIEDAYFEKLLAAFENDSKLGITSGVIFDETGKKDLANQNWVRGGCRIWSQPCFLATGYKIEPAEDTISAARAILGGWKVYTTKDAKAYSRAVSSRVNYGYYANAAYFRGHTWFYAVLKSFALITKLHFKKGIQYIHTYHKCLLAGKPRVEDMNVRNFFKSYLIRKYTNRPFFGRN